MSARGWTEPPSGPMSPGALAALVHAPASCSLKSARFEARVTAFVLSNARVRHRERFGRDMACRFAYGRPRRSHGRSARVRQDFGHVTSGMERGASSRHVRCRVAAHHGLASQGNGKARDGRSRQGTGRGRANPGGCRPPSPTCSNASTARISRSGDAPGAAGAGPAPASRRGPRGGQARAPRPPRRARLRPAALGADGRGGAHRSRGRAAPPLPVGEPLDLRAHRVGRHRWLRARHAGAGLGRRSPLPPALQADRLGRERGRGDPLRALGPQAEGRARHPLGGRMPAGGQGGHDDPHRAPGGPLRLRRPRPLRRASGPLRRERGPGLGARVRGRQAARARRPGRQGRTVALPRRAERQGRQGGPARPQHPVLDRQVRLPRPRAGGARGGRPVHAGGVPPLRPLRGVPVAGALPDALPHRAAGGAADLRPPAPGGRAPRLSRAAAGCPASSAS